MFPILWLVLWLAPLQVRPAARGTIQGLVTRAGAVAGAPQQQLAEALVVLKPGNVSTLTDANGAFTFRNLAPGRYSISVSRDGFIPQEDRSRGLTLSGMTVTLAAGQTLKDIVMPMIPSPVIAGTVLDPHGETLAGALVRAYARRYTPYGPQLRFVQKGMTDDMGAFRLFGLNFGEYIVSAGYSDRDRDAAVGKTQLSANVSKADDGYSTIFYDGEEDISRAQAVHVAPGSDSVRLSINLSDSLRFKIRGQVLPANAGAKIVLAPKGSDLSDADYVTQANANGTFEIRAVTPGSYVLLATNGDLSSDVVAVNVIDNDIDGVRFALQGTMSVSGTLFVEGDPRADLSDYRIKLVRSSIEFQQRIESPSSSDGRFTLAQALLSADYDVEVGPLPPGLYVKSINAAGRSLLGGRSRLTPLQPMQIALAVAADSLDVHVTSGNDAVPGVQVVLIPDVSLRRRADRYVTGFTGESGDVRLSAVAPGRYTAYAFERIEPDAYYVLANDPVAENRFLDRAAAVIVGDGGTRTIQLKLIPAAETAGGIR